MLYLRASTKGCINYYFLSLTRLVGRGQQDNKNNRITIMAAETYSCKWRNVSPSPDVARTVRVFGSSSPLLFKNFLRFLLQSACIAALLLHLRLRKISSGVMAHDGACSEQMPQHNHKRRTFRIRFSSAVSSLWRSVGTTGGAGAGLPLPSLLNCATLACWLPAGCCTNVYPTGIPAGRR